MIAMTKLCGYIAIGQFICCIGSEIEDQVQKAWRQENILKRYWTDFMYITLSCPLYTLSLPLNTVTFLCPGTVFIWLFINQSIDWINYHS